MDAMRAEMNTVLSDKMMEAVSGEDSLTTILSLLIWFEV